MFAFLYHFLIFAFFTFSFVVIGVPGKRQGSFRIEKKMTEKSKGSSHTDINHRMLLQEHRGHNNKHCKNKRSNSYVLLSAKGLAIGQ